MHTSRTQNMKATSSRSTSAHALLRVLAVNGVDRGSITGEEGGRPVRVGYQVADLAGGLYLALATVAALAKSQSTGQGKLVQISLFDAQVAMLTWQAQGWLCGGPLPRATGARHAMIAPSDIFQAADGRWVALAPTGERFWHKLCEAIGQPELADDARFSDATARITHVRELTATLAGVIARRPSAEWLSVFKEARVPAAVVQDVKEALEHPLVAQRHMIEPVARPSDGSIVPMLGNPFKYAQAPELGYPPVLGADTADVLQQVAGYSPAQVEELARAGAIGLAQGALQ